jgi:hypothetical protein
MAKKALDRILRGPKLNAVTAEKVFDWKNVHNHPMTRAVSLWLKEANRPI